MRKPFRNIHKKSLQGSKTTSNIIYVFGEIILANNANAILCPVRDNILVAIINTKSNPRAFRYEIL